MEQRDPANSLSPRRSSLLSSRTRRIIARKVWFLRHAQSCRTEPLPASRPCKQAFLLLAHMRACGAFQDPERGCRAPPAAGPRDCCTTPELPPRSLRGAARRCAPRAHGRRLVVPKDLVQAADVRPAVHAAPRPAGSTCRRPSSGSGALPLKITRTSRRRRPSTRRA